jgi:hypothetical protein
MSNKLTSLAFGRLRKAPEHFLEGELLAQVSQNGLDAQRRNFIRTSFLGALATATGASALAQSTATLGDPAILDKHLRHPIKVRVWFSTTRITRLNESVGGVGIVYPFARFVWDDHAKRLALRTPSPGVV